jgi:MerR family transcriptional regulator/heat shock protein HspR
MGQLEDKKMKSEFSLKEISKIVKLDQREIEELEREGIVNYSNREKKTLAAQDLERIKAAAALKNDMGVNAAGIDIILQLKEKLVSLQEEFEKLLVDVTKKD